MKKTLTALAISSALLANTAIADNKHWKTYHVKVTNTTAHHVITPPTVVAHNGRYKMFEVTQPASEEVATMAETGNPGPLSMAASEDGNVYSVEVGMSLNEETGMMEPTVIPPGHSLVVTIEAPRRAFFTVAGMLATTNDAFMASVNIKAPRVHRYAYGHGMTYDAGSEMNNESCDYIPGPPCNNGVNMRANGVDPETGMMMNEGFVTIHNGVHGVGDLMPKHLDWRGPTAMISIHNDG